ncbi:MAG TPA: efflux transporter outer membrane subunit [Rhizorhapis sp.]
MMLRKFPLALLATIILAGCNMAPEYHRPAMPVPAELPFGSTEPQQGTIEPADLAWRDFFTDERLRRLIALALENNRDLRVALANVAQARAQFHVQRADLAPGLSANAGATFERNSAGLSGSTAIPGAENGGGTANGVGRRLDIYSVEAGISAWEIDLFGRLRNLDRAAQEQYFASQSARDATQTALIAELASAYLTLAADQDRLNITRDTLSAFGQTFELTRERFRGGIASELDVQQAQTSRDQARSDMAELTTLVAQDRNRLNLLVGATVPAELLPTGLSPNGSTIAQLPGNLDSTILLRRPDIAEAESLLRAANASIGAARAAFFPKISLTAVAGTMSLGLSNLFGGGSDTWTVAPSATMPIFDFGRTKGNLRYAEASRDVALARYEQSIQSAFREVADALAQRETIGTQLDALTSLRNAASGAYRLSEARYRAGIEPFLNTLDAQRTLYAAQQGLISSRLTAETNLIELYRSLGGGLR